jgi:hypothetical protein
VLTVLNAVGLFTIVTGWAWASGETAFDDQFPAANLAIAGLMVALAGNLAWLFAGRRALRRVKLSLFRTHVEGS